MPSFDLYQENHMTIPQIGSQVQLTQEQRLHCYNWMLMNYEKVGRGPFLCNVILVYFFGDIRWAGEAISYNPLELLPELMMQKPEDHQGDHPWWDGREEGNLNRRIALLKAIQLCQEQGDLL